MLPSLAWIWVHEMSPFLGPHWGNIGIRYYGLAYVLGFFAGAWLLYRYARAGRSQLPAQQIPDFMVWIVFGVMLGGRIGDFVLYPAQHNLVGDPLSFLRIWEGGMASHGGFIGVTIAIAWFARRQKISFGHIADLVCSVGPAGLFFGRIANFINGELWGNPTDGSWGVIFNNTGGGPLPRHPSQLYEAVLEGLVLLAFTQWRFWRTDVTRTHPGRLAGEFLIAYAFVRAIGEIFREPDADRILGLTRGTFYSLFLIIGGLILTLRRPKVNS